MSICYILDTMENTWDNYENQWIFYHCGISEIDVSMIIKSEESTGKIESCEFKSNIKEENITGKIKVNNILGKITDTKL